MNLKRMTDARCRPGAVVAALALSACATTPATDPRDPMEDWNRSVQSFNDEVDDYVMKPVASGYQSVTPSFVDRGVTNFYSNIKDISVFVNDFLQLKMLQGGQDAGRFFINTAAGLGGLFDLATPLGLVKHNEDFDQTLATWGVPSGPYLVLPFAGSTTPRAAAGFPGEIATNPINYIAPVAIPWMSGALRVTDTRADLLNTGKIAEEAAVDRYEFLRNAYFQERVYQIYDGNPPVDEELEKEMEADLAASDAGNAEEPQPRPTP